MLVQLHGTQLLLDRFLWSVIFEYFFENLSRKFKFHYDVTRIVGNLHDDLCTFKTVFCHILCRMRNVSDKSCIAKHTNYIQQFFFKSYHLSDNVEEYSSAEQATDDNIIYCMCFACWIRKATHTHTLQISNTYCFSMATMVTCTCLNVMLYVHCRSYCISEEEMYSLCARRVHRLWKNPSWYEECDSSTSTVHLRSQKSQGSHSIKGMHSPL